MKTTPAAKENNRRTMEGVVVGKSGQKTAKVEVSRKLQHPIYRKQVNRTKRYLVHDPLEKCAVGDLVIIRESRPISKTKHWTLESIVTSVS